MRTKKKTSKNKIMADKDNPNGTATPELRQQLIDKLTEMRKEKFGIE